MRQCLANMSQGYKALQNCMLAMHYLSTIYHLFLNHCQPSLKTSPIPMHHHQPLATSMHYWLLAINKCSRVHHCVLLIVTLLIYQLTTTFVELKMSLIDYLPFHNQSWWTTVVKHLCYNWTSVTTPTMKCQSEANYTKQSSLNHQLMTSTTIRKHHYSTWSTTTGTNFH